MARLQLQYGGHSFSTGEVSLHIVRRAVRGQTGYRMFRRESWNVTGVLIAASQSALTTSMDTLRDALNLDNRDLKLVFESAGGDTHHKLLTSDTLNGVVIADFQWLEGLPGQWGMHTEYVYLRSYRFRAEADVLDQEGSDLFLWSESVEQIGDGGPDFAVQENLAGIPIRQDTMNATAGRAVQKGYAVGFTSYPSPPSVLFPGLLKGKHARFRRETPKTFGKQRNTMWPFSWDYPYLAPTAISGVAPPLPSP